MGGNLFLRAWWWLADRSHLYGEGNIPNPRRALCPINIDPSPSSNSHYSFHGLFLPNLTPPSIRSDLMGLSDNSSPHLSSFASPAFKSAPIKDPPRERRNMRPSHPATQPPLLDLPIPYDPYLIKIQTLSIPASNTDWSSGDGSQPGALDIRLYLRYVPAVPWETDREWIWLTVTNTIPSM